MKRILLILSLLLASNAQAGLNKWVDADGKVHYSDQPPPANVEVQTLHFSTPEAAPSADVDSPAPASAPAAASAPAVPKTIAEREAELKKAQQAEKEAADKAAKEQAKAQEKQAYCDAVQQNLRMLQSGTRMMEVDDKGERYYLSDEQRSQRIEKLQQDMAANCK